MSKLFVGPVVITLDNSVVLDIVRIFGNPI